MPAPPSIPANHPTTRPTVPLPGVLGLLTSFSVMSSIGFGGVFPWARTMVVEQRRWLTQDEFNEIFAFCQFLPGPNMLNFAVVFGARCAGAIGSLVALFGLLMPPTLIVIALAVLYGFYGDMPSIQGILAGEAAAAAGLIIGASGKIAAPLFRRRAGPAPYVAVALFIAIGIFRLPLVWVLAAGTPISIALAWWWRR
ncbi:MAG: chromate transporter [Rhizobiales bacterium]|nr:chromate transporter [Hyphomicrobiales bacterium]